MPRHYLNQCCAIDNWTLKNKFQWNSNQNTKLFIHENASENIVCEMAAILSRGNELILEQQNREQQARVHIALGILYLDFNHRLIWDEGRNTPFACFPRLGQISLRPQTPAVMEGLMAIFGSWLSRENFVPYPRLSKVFVIVWWRNIFSRL